MAEEEYRRQETEDRSKKHKARRQKKQPVVGSQ